MIVQLTEDGYPADTFAIGLRDEVPLDEMMRRLGARPGSYAARLVETIHWGIFCNSLNLRRDYESYFAAEYQDFRAYLSRRERYPDDFVQMIGDLYPASEVIVVYEPEMGILNGARGRDLLSTLLTESTE